MNYYKLSIRWLCAALLMLPAMLGWAQTGWLEYWFDNYSSSGTRTTSLSQPVVTTDGLSQGFHTLCMRVKLSDGTYSPIYTDTFFKFPTTTNSVLEYWFDDNIMNKATIPIDTETEVLQTLDLDMRDASKFPLGFHRLNMRVAAGRYSPIYSALVMRVSEGQPSELICWLDDNYKKRSVLTGEMVNGVTTYFVSLLNLSSVSVGMHRLKYRITSNGFDDGVIYEEPILVTRLYNNQENVAIAEESLWLDDLLNLPSLSFNPQPIVTRKYTLNPNDYDVGEHVFYVQYKNSSGVWGVPNATYFYKDDSGKLYAGRRTDDVTGIANVEDSEVFCCDCQDGTLFIDCQSPKLAATGTIVVCDYGGRVIVRQTVRNSDGIRAQIDVSGHNNQLLLVRMLSGDFQMSKKILVK